MRAAIMAIDNEQAQSKENHLKGLMTAIAKNQDKTAFAAIFEYFAPRIKSYFLKSGMHDDTAEDLVQKTMIAVWQKAASYNAAKAAVSTWIFTIARNKRTDFLRQQHLPELDLDDPALALADGADDAQTQLEKAENEEKLTRAIAALPVEQSDLLRRAFFEGKSHIKIAEETALPLGTIKSRLRLALDKLRKKMTEEDG